MHSGCLETFENQDILMALLLALGHSTHALREREREEHVRGGLRQAPLGE